MIIIIDGSPFSPNLQTESLISTAVAAAEETMATRWTVTQQQPTIYSTSNGSKSIDGRIIRSPIIIVLIVRGSLYCIFDYFTVQTDHKIAT